MDRARPHFVASLIVLFTVLVFDVPRAQPAAPPSDLGPDRFQSQDIGAVGAPGSSELVGSRFIVRGSGADVWGAADEFHFARTRIAAGDFAFTAYVTHVDDVDRWTKAGLMIRDGLAANARHAFLFATPPSGRGVAFQRRPTTGGTSVHTDGPAIAPPFWLRLERDDDTVSAFVRVSETDEWTEVSRHSFPRLSINVEVGLAVTSHLDGALAEGWFEQVTLDQYGLPPLTSIDVGDVGNPGASWTDGDGDVDVVGAGADIWGTADAFHFRSQEMTGNFEFTSYVCAFDAVNAWTKVGLMMRESLDPGARHAFVLATPTEAKGIAFQRRVTTGGSSLHTAGPSVAPCAMLRLVRTGDVVTASYMLPPDFEWVRFGIQTFASLPPTILVGLAVSSHRRGTLAQGRFVEPVVRPGSPDWIASDIGDVAAAGRSFIDEDSGPEFAVTGSGADVWGRADEFHFLSREMNGDFDFSARMAFVDQVHGWTKAGLMMRDGLSADARHAFVIQTPGTQRAVAFQRRLVAGGTSVHSPGPATAPPGFLRLTRVGDVITAYHRTAPTDSWTTIGSERFPSLPATVRIGFAVSSHVDGVLATGHFDNMHLVP
jgi:regulation of enolase protein 1 (concanavalin A-like superfamily)